MSLSPCGGCSAILVETEKARAQDRIIYAVEPLALDSNVLQPSHYGCVMRGAETESF